MTAPDPPATDGSTVMQVSHRVCVPQVASGMNWSSSVPPMPGSGAGSGAGAATSGESDTPAESDVLTKILVLPSLPTAEPFRSQSVELLKQHGTNSGEAS